MKTKSLILIIIAGVLWGTSCLFVNALSGYGISSIQMTAVRGTVSFVCMTIFCLILRRKALFTNLKSLLLFILGGIALFATATLYYMAMQLTTVSVAVVLLYTSPVIVMVASTFIFKEKITKVKLISVFIMLLGSVLVSGIFNEVKFDVLGLLLGILSSVCYSIYNILTKLQMKNGDDPYTATVYTFATISLISVFASNPKDIVIKAAENPLPVIPLLIGIGIVTFVLPYFLYTLSLKELSASTASTMSVMEPMSASVFGMAFLGEKPTVFGILGIALVIASVIMISLGEKERKSAKPQVEYSENKDEKAQNTV